MYTHVSCVYEYYMLVQSHQGDTDTLKRHQSSVVIEEPALDALYVCLVKKHRNMRSARDDGDEINLHTIAESSLKWYSFIPHPYVIPGHVLRLPAYATDVERTLSSSKICRVIQFM